MTEREMALEMSLNCWGVIRELKKVGLETVEALATATEEELQKARGVGPVRAAWIHNAAVKALQEKAGGQSLPQSAAPTAPSSEGAGERLQALKDQRALEALRQRNADRAAEGVGPYDGERFAGDREGRPYDGNGLRAAGGVGPYDGGAITAGASPRPTANTEDALPREGVNDWSPLWPKEANEILRTRFRVARADVGEVAEETGLNGVELNCWLAGNKDLITTKLTVIDLYLSRLEAKSENVKQYVKEYMKIMENVNGVLEAPEKQETAKTARPSGTDSAKVLSVIVTEALVGSGTAEDPCRVQKRYWSMDGELLAESVSEQKI